MNFSIDDPRLFEIQVREAYILYNSLAVARIGFNCAVACIYQVNLTGG